MLLYLFRTICFWAGSGLAVIGIMAYLLDPIVLKYRDEMVFGGGLIGVLLLTICGVAGLFIPTQYGDEFVAESRELISLADDTKIHGNYLLFSESGVYRFYYQEKDGGIVQDEVYASKTKVFYSDERPRIDRIEREFWTAYSNGKKPWLVQYRSTEFIGYRIYVPKGTIVEDFTLDLQ